MHPAVSVINTTFLRLLHSINWAINVRKKIHGVYLIQYLFVFLNIINVHFAVDSNVVKSGKGPLVPQSTEAPKHRRSVAAVHVLTPALKGKRMRQKLNYQGRRGNREWLARGTGISG